MLLSKVKPLVLAVCFSAALTSRLLVDACIHDQLDHKLSSHVLEYGESHPFEVARRRRQRRLDGDGDGGLLAVPHEAQQDYERAMGQEVNEAAYESIRITAYYDNSTLDALPAEKRAVIFKIIPDAIARFKRLLSVVPVQGNLTATRSCDVQWSTTPPVCKTVVSNERCLEMPMPSSHFAPTRVCNTCLTTGCAVGDCSTIPGQGVANSDFVLYVRAANTAYCSGSVLAYASSCQKDQYDRPTFGMTNFCPSMIKTDPYQYRSQLSTAMHEITHALGFSSHFFPLMRNKDGTPRTARDANGQPRSFTNTKCPNGKPTSFYTPPSTTTVQFTSERDTTVARMVTPSVAAFVRKHFGCDSLPGAEIENQDDGCLGSHWEERIFEPEYMTPISSFRNVLSGLTLAFFEDSGWYKTNTSTAERLHFGESQGCAFATSKCITKATGESIAPDHFCTTNTEESCSVDASARSVCSLSSSISDIPPEFQYFSSPTTGGNNEYADYCPINTGFRSGDCAVPDNLVVPPGTSINILGETYCPTCKCTATTLRSSDSFEWAVNSRRRTGCYAMRCPTNMTVEINVPIVGDSTKVHKVICTTKGQELKVTGYRGVITCPDPRIVCDRSCPGACSGNGVCNFASATCTCNNGWKGEDCATNTTLQTSLRTMNHAAAGSGAWGPLAVAIISTLLYM